MKIQLLYMAFGLVCFSCQSTNEKSTITSETQTDTISTTDTAIQLSPDAADASNSAYKIITETVTVLAVAEELIMPGDYLTTAMTVKTSKNDTLVFLDMFEHEKLVGQKITVHYKILPQLKLLICSNCTTYNKPVYLTDITTSASEITFKKMKLKEYQSDAFIVPASKFIMIGEDGSTEEYYSNEISIHDDTIKLANAFYSYGTTLLYAPELQNRKELEQLLLK